MEAVRDNMDSQLSEIILERLDDLQSIIDGLRPGYVRGLMPGYLKNQEKHIAALEDRNAELERFNYTLFHDLQAPLSKVKSFIDKLRFDVNPGDTKQANQYINQIHNAVEKLDALLKELMEFSGIGGIIYAHEPISIYELAREVMNLNPEWIKKQCITVSTELGPIYVYGDRFRLREVLQNLVENAMKFMGDQLNPRVEIGYRDQKGETIFYVRDNGLGIAPEHHNKIFNLFFQLNPETEGTGVGLTRAKRIIELHGGKIWVKSTGLKNGSTFCFILQQKFFI